MGPNERDDGRNRLDLGLSVPNSQEDRDVVFDFSGMPGLGLGDLAWVLTARLQAGPRGRVWVRQMPFEAWNALRALGLDHLFRVYPGPGEQPN
jgi:hypothetical protein